MPRGRCRLGFSDDGTCRQDRTDRTISFENKSNLPADPAGCMKNEHEHVPGTSACLACSFSANLGILRFDRSGNVMQGNSATENDGISRH